MRNLSIIPTPAECQQKQTTGAIVVCELSTQLRIQRINATPNIFLIQNKGKGPPGRSRSPDRGNRLSPDTKPAAGKSSKIIIQIIQYQYFNFYHN